MKADLLTIKDAQKPQIQEFLDTLKKTKREAAARGDEELANNCWRKIESLELNLLFIGVFNKIKSKKYRDAWRDLEECEIKCNSIEKNSSQEFLIRSRTKFIKDKATKWQSLYPYCVFASPEFAIGYYTCSICDHKIRPRSRCKHKRGKVYNGELCVHVVHDMEFRGISFVTRPVQKYSVIHNDETLDFSLINYLSDLLENAFEEWDLNWTRKSFPIEKFSNVDPDGECPCRSGKSFKDCCINKNEVEIPHVDFILAKNIPKDKAGIRFPY
ncbi:SEC-C metal-binding domain-containing protein [Thermodesulfobacteriota bacterium]